MRFNAGHVGIAVTRDLLVAWCRNSKAGAMWRRDIVVEDEADVRAAFDELRDTMQLRKPRATVTLLPPLASVRRLQMPPLRDAELRMVLTRDAARYFITDGIPQIVGAFRLGKRQSGASYVMAGAASTALVTSIHRAATDGGWKIDACVPAAAAWCVAAAASHVEARSAALVLVALQGELLLLASKNAEPIAIRRALNGAGLSRALSEIQTSVGMVLPVVIIAPAHLQQDLSNVMISSEARVLRTPSLPFEPVAAAARYANRGRKLALIPEIVLEAYNRRARRMAIRWCITAACSIVLYLAIAWTQTRRQLSSVNLLRSEMHERVGRAVKSRATIVAVDTRLAALATLERKTPLWTTVLSRLALQLPRDAYITAFRAEGGVLTVEGVSHGDTTLVEAVRRATGIATVRSRTSIEDSSGTIPIHRVRFALSAQYLDSTQAR